MPGEKLQPEVEYARMLGVSGNSLRKPLRSLENSGLAVKRHGIGTFVTESRPVIRVSMPEHGDVGYAGGIGTAGE
ncbi:MAG: FadR family transcriptional regulator [Firmicutes bacterium]|nr:FadR family transcriptional regulator [Bacillota bacterium]